MSEKTETTDNSNFAITFTLIFYILYFMYIKPVVTLDILKTPEKYEESIKKTYFSTGILFACVLMIQLLSNTIGFQSKCQGNFISNFGKVFGATFLPWFAIMGSVMISLLVFPALFHGEILSRSSGQLSAHGAFAEACAGEGGGRSEPVL